MSELQNEESSSPPSESQAIRDDRRLWIGNLDPRVTEYQLLKLMQQHGAIEKFDLLFHRTGPQCGQPRGYAFITYMRKQDALNAKNLLNNKLMGSKNIIVTWAHSISTEEVEKAKPELNIPALAMTKSGTKLNRESQIQAIEAKLKLMQHKSTNELEINRTVAAEPSVMPLYQIKKVEAATPVANELKHRKSTKKFEKNSGPYNKKRTKR